VNLTKRQEEIVESATVLIGDKGVQNLTTKKLAAKMGFSEPALYRHFKGKTEILKAVLNYYRENMGLGLNKIISTEQTGLEKIQKMLIFQFRHFSNYPAVVMVIFSETSFQYDSVLSKVVNNILMSKRAMVRKMFQKGQQDGSIRKDVDAEQLATIVMGSMRLTLLEWRLNDFNFNLIERGDTLWDSIEILIKKE